MRIILVAFILCLAFVGTAAKAEFIYSDRTTFESVLDVFITDDYSGYTTLGITYFQNHEMNAVFGETKYQAVYSNQNFVSNYEGTGDYFYCTGCNGSYLLDFTSTSVGDASGVFGVGLDIVPVNVFNTTAFVTFGDGTTENYLLPEANDGTGYLFWGITADELISSIHFGLPNGAPNTNNAVQRMAMDNLTIGSAISVPEPGTLSLFGIGLAGMGLVRRRRKA